MARLTIAWLVFGLALAGNTSAAELSPEAAERIDTMAAETCRQLRASYSNASIPPGFERLLADNWKQFAAQERVPCPTAHHAQGEETHAPLLPFAPPPGQGDGPRLPLDDPTIPPDDTLTTWLKVFLDADEDGEFDEGEEGMPSIQVSNGMIATPLGLGVFLTEIDGTHTFQTALYDSRMVFMTVPSGYTATTSFWHRLDSAVNPDSVYFGLRETPETANTSFRLVQMSDMQVANQLVEGLEHGDDLTEIESLALPPDFIVITGDLVQTGEIDLQWDHYLAGEFGHDSIPIHHGYGDHDGLWTSQNVALEVDQFEQRFGPTCYSFEYGGIHFVMFNDFHPVAVDSTFKQYGWLSQDIVVARARTPDIPFVICKHMMPAQAEINLYNGFTNGLGTFSGHWHGSRVREVQGVFDVNTPPSRFGGIDKTSRGFRIIDMDNGELTTYYREGGISEHLRIVTPAEGDTVLASPISILVNAFNTASDHLTVEYTIDGPGGSTPLTPMTLEGTWAWTAEWDATNEPDTTYQLTVNVTPDIGAPYSQMIEFEVVRGSFVVQPDAFFDWPSYKYDAAGTGRCLDNLVPPLRLVWARNLGSPINVPSPAVANGRVYIGTSNISTTNEARMFCLEASTGATLWEVPTLNDVKSTPAVHENSVYFTNSTGNVFALDATSGDILWQEQLGDSLSRWEMTSPTYHDGMVYVGGAPWMAALDAVTGAVAWRDSGSTIGDFFPSTYSAPAVNDEVAVFTSKFGIFVYERLSGVLRWKVNLPSYGSRVHRSAAIVDSLVYTAGYGFNSQNLRVYDLETGDLVAGGNGTPSVSGSTSAPVVGPGPGGEGTRVIVAYGGSQNSGGAPNYGRMLSFVPPESAIDWTLYLIGDMISCSLPYKRDVASINSTPAWAGNYVYFGADDGILYCADPETGARLWSYDLGIPLRSSPAVAGNMLFINGSDGTLYAFASTFIAPASAGSSATPGALRTRLLGNWPNPFNPATTIRFDLGPTDAAQPVSIKIYDTTGRHIRTLLNQKLESGSHTHTWDGRNDAGQSLASSVYFYELRTATQSFRRKLVLAK